MTDEIYTHDEDGRPLCGRCGAPVAHFDHGWYHALTEDFHGYCFWGQPFLYEDAPDLVDTDQPTGEHETPASASTPAAPIHPELEDILVCNCGMNDILNGKHYDD